MKISRSRIMNKQGSMLNCESVNPKILSATVKSAFESNSKKEYETGNTIFLKNVDYFIK